MTPTGVLLAYIPPDRRRPHPREGRRTVPCIVFTKGGGLWLADIADSGTDAVGLDWTVDIGAARAWSATRSRCRATSTRPCCSAAPEAVAAEARKVLDAYGPTGHVFNLGHGISQFTRRRTSRCWSTPSTNTAASPAQPRPAEGLIR